MSFPDTDLDVRILAHLGADPTADSGTWPAATDWTSLLADREVRVSLGRDPGQNSAKSGSCTFWLDDPNLALSTSDLIGTPVAVNVVHNAVTYGRFRGFIVSVDPEVQPGAGGAGKAVVRVTLGGILRQRSKGKDPKSVARRFIERTAPDGWWPLEDGPDVGGLRSETGDPDMTVSRTGAMVAADRGELAAWLLDGVRLPNFVAVRGVMTGTSSTAWAIDVLYRIDASRGDDLIITLEGWYAASTSQALIVRLWGAGTTTPSVVELLFPNLATSLGTTALGTSAHTGNVLHHLRLSAAQNGGNVDVTVYLDGASIATDSYAGTLEALGRVGVWYLDEPAGTTTFNSASPVTVGHIVAYGAGAPSVADAAWATARGYAGEMAHVRMGRICDEEGIEFASSATVSAALGPQPIVDPLDALRDAEAVDHGVLYETPDAWGLSFRSRRERYGQDPAFTIDLDTYNVTGHAGGNLITPSSSNDGRLRNEWTVSRPGGGSVTVKNEAHQAKRGRYNDSAEVNVFADEQLLDEGLWRVHLGTYDRRRWPTVPLDLGANPGLIEDWLDLIPGARIDRTGHALSYLERLDVLGYTETMRRRSWRASLVTEPYALYDPGTYQATPIDENTKRYDTLGSTLTSQVVAGTATSFQVTVAAGHSLWTLTSASWVGLQVEAGGVIWAVTSITGSSSPQTINVAQAAVNGVVKTVAAGTQVRVAPQQRATYGL